MGMEEMWERRVITWRKAMRIFARDLRAILGEEEGSTAHKPSSNLIKGRDKTRILRGEE
jgi:hypothetical protein